MEQADSISEAQRRVVAIDLLRACAATMRAVRDTRQTLRRADRDTAAVEASWILGERQGLLPLAECIRALFGDRDAASQDVIKARFREALLERPEDVLTAIDSMQGNGLDHFAVHGAAALQAEAMSACFLQVGLVARNLAKGMRLDADHLSDLHVELEWLFAPVDAPVGALPAVDCLSGSLRLRGQEAVAALERLRAAVPARIVSAFRAGTLEDLPAQALHDAPEAPALLAAAERAIAIANEFRRLAEEGFTQPVDSPNRVSPSMGSERSAPRMAA